MRFAKNRVSRLELLIVLLLALAIGVGFMNILAALAAEFHSKLDALHRRLESRLRPGVDTEYIKSRHASSDPTVLRRPLFDSDV